MLNIYAISVQDVENAYVYDFLKSCKSVTIYPIYVTNETPVDDETYLKCFEQKQEQYELPLEMVKVKGAKDYFPEQFNFAEFLVKNKLNIDAINEKCDISLSHLRKLAKGQKPLTYGIAKRLWRGFKNKFEKHCTLKNIVVPF